MENMFKMTTRFLETRVITPITVECSMLPLMPPMVRRLTPFISSKVAGEPWYTRDLSILTIKNLPSINLEIIKDTQTYNLVLSLGLP